MVATSETTTIALIALIAFGILGWGFYRARPYGKLGILAWLQSVVLMVPWLLFFGLFAFRIYLNLAGILLLLVISAGTYIWLGNKLRTAGQEAILRERIQRLAELSEQYDSDAKQAEQTTTPSTDHPGIKLPDLDLHPIPNEDLKQIQGIFGVDTFFAVETIPYQEGAIFKGNLRGDPETVHQRLSGLLTDRLGDRYRLFLVENPEGRPTVIVLPSTVEPQPLTIAQKILSGVLGIATLATCLERGGLQYGIDLLSNSSRLLEVFPIALGIVLVLAAHELGHWFLARRYGIKISLPFFIPGWQIGSYGAITRFLSLLPDRKTLFDISFAGPAAGGGVSLVLLLTGLLLSPHGGIPLPSQFFEGSMLVGALARTLLGDRLQEMVVLVHPLAVAGWLGMVITAINLMPAGQLDGGRIIQAIYGRKVLSRTSLATFIFLAIASFANPLALYWAIIVVFLQRQPERPSLNELTEPDDARAALGLLMLFLMVATLLPLTPTLAGRLGIGG